MHTSLIEETGNCKIHYFLRILHSLLTNTQKSTSVITKCSLYDLLEHVNNPAFENQCGHNLHTSNNISQVILEPLTIQFYGFLRHVITLNLRNCRDYFI